VSRLARSNADLARLAEMARLTGTLLIDSDGVYDLSDFNDWLVLGLKSTMSQAELHIMAGRLQAAKLAAAERRAARPAARRARLRRRRHGRDRPRCRGPGSRR
jgi:DNA invertase Pin-like site-specific DNA recombinase